MKNEKSPSRIPLKELPAKKHDKFLDEMIAILQEGFDLISDRMIDEILSQMKSEKLAKSDHETIMKLLGTKAIKGTTGEIPRVEMDLSFTADLMDKYIAAIRWMLLGKSAGPQVEKWVEELGLKAKLPVGVMYGTFLHAVDQQREFYERMRGRSPAKFNEDILRYTLDFVNERTAKWADQSLLTYRNKMLQTLQDKIEEFNQNNLADVHGEYHFLVQEKEAVGKQINTIEQRHQLVRESMKNVMEKKMSLNQMKQHLQDVTKDYGKDWDRLVNTEFGMASGAGTHMAMQELFGKDDPDMRVALVNVRDERCCDTCEQLARNPDGTLKIYALSEVKPVGYNIGKKRSEWAFSSGNVHPNCRCTTVYIPPGFDIDKQGHLVAKQKEQK